MSKICKKCGKEVKDEYDFCVYCGERLPKHLICPDCEKEYLEIDYGFCGKCGGKLIPIDDFKEIDLSFLDDHEQISYKFWTAFLKEAQKQENEFIEFWKAQLFWHVKDFCMKDVYPSFAIFPPRFYFGKDYIECKIHIGDNKPLYHHLHKKRNQFDREFGSKLIWEEKNTVGNIITRTNLSIDNPDDWDDMIHWYMDTMNKFSEVFKDEIIEFAGTIDDIERYQYWLKVDEALEKTDLKNISNYTVWNYKEIGFCDISMVYGFMKFTKYKRNRPLVQLIIRNWDMYEYLLNDKENIEKELGFSLNWQDNWKIFISTDIPNKPEFEDEIIQWQIDTGLKIDEVFSKRIKEFVG